MRSVCFGAFCGLFFMVRVFAAIVVTDDEGKKRKEKKYSSKGK